MSTRLMRRRNSKCGRPDVGDPLCPPHDGRRFRSLEEIADHYIEKRRPETLKEFRSFKNDPSLRDCIRRAARALDENDCKHPHQWRVPPAALNAFANILTRKESVIAQCESFKELFAIVEGASKHIWRHAELTVYDTAWRIAGRLGLEPEAVYLHTGTRKGARALGITGRGPVPVKQLPNGVWKLKARELEDCLCLYRDRFPTNVLARRYRRSARTR